MLFYQGAFPRNMFQSFNNISVYPPFQKNPQNPSLKIHSKKTRNFKFAKDEDEKLCLLVKRFGENSWSTVAKNMKNRNPRQCRERWKNYLNPMLKKNDWTEEDDLFLLRKYQEIGPHWNKITQHFQNRSINSVRNRFIKLEKSIKSKNNNLLYYNVNNFPQVIQDPNKILQQNNFQEYIPTNFILPVQSLINFPINSNNLNQNLEKQIKNSKLFLDRKSSLKSDEKKKSSTLEVMPERNDLFDIFSVQTDEIDSLDSLSSEFY